MKKELRLVLPKGRLLPEILDLMRDAGLPLSGGERDYRPQSPDPELVLKVMKPQNIPLLLAQGSHDLGFTGLDWVLENGVRLEEVWDTGFNPVRIVVASPAGASFPPSGEPVVATEYPNLTRSHFARRGWPCRILKTYGATEVFPPDDADLIVDNSASGKTLVAHNLREQDEVLCSSTRLFMNPALAGDGWKRGKVADLLLLFNAVLMARERVMLEMNLDAGRLEEVVRQLPCMRAPTVAPLYNGGGYAVKIVVRRKEIAALLPRLRSLGASDIVETEIRKAVP